MSLIEPAIFRCVDTSDNWPLLSIPGSRQTGSQSKPQQTTMYRSQRCFQLVGPGVPSNNLVVAMRPRTYSWTEVYQSCIHNENDPRVDDKLQKERRAREQSHDSNPTGWETVKEIRVCPPCQSSGKSMGFTSNN